MLFVSSKMLLRSDAFVFKNLPLKRLLFQPSQYDLRLLQHRLGCHVDAADVLKV